MMKRNRIRPVAAAVFLGVAVVLGGCGQPAQSEASSAVPDASPNSAASVSEPAADPSGAPASATSEPTQQASGAQASAAAGGECRAGQLEASIETEAGAGAAGSVYRSLVLTNKGSQDCTVRGYPGVSYVDSKGTEIGAPADRDPDAEADTVSLTAGASAVAQLQQTNAQNYGPECELTDVAGVKVYPPNDTEWLVAPQSTVACADDAVVLMTVGTFAAR